MAVRLAGLLLALSLCASAQMKMTVEQLISFIKSSVELKHPDKQVADYLKKVKLTNQLDDRVIEELHALGAGPHTREALRQLKEASAGLPKAELPAPKPPPAPIPPPSEAEQKRIIEAAREYAMNYNKRLPDFICTQVTRRYYDPTGLEFWQRDDVITARLSYFEQKEDYKVVLVNNRMTESSMDQLGGATSTGEFGSMLKEIFDKESEAVFTWERWTTWRGKRTYVFAYHVPRAKSKWRISYQRTMDYVPGYRGLIYIDRDTEMIMRITLEAEDIPASFPIQQASTKLDYDFVDISGHTFVLPLKAEVRMRNGRNLVKNEVEFRMYRKFGTESTIKFETPDPLPEEATQEQPVKQEPPAKQP